MPARDRDLLCLKAQLIVLVEDKNQIPKPGKVKRELSTPSSVFSKCILQCVIHDNYSST